MFSKKRPFSSKWVIQIDKVSLRQFSESVLLGSQPVRPLKFAPLLKPPSYPSPFNPSRDARAKPIKK